jgi:hypothetical protein
VLPFVNNMDTKWLDIPSVITLSLDLHKMA